MGPGEISAHKSSVWPPVFSPGGRQLATTSNDGTVQLWSLAFSPAGDMLAVAGGDGTITLWDPHEGRLLGGIAAHARQVSVVTFSPDGRLLASGGDDGVARLRDVTGPEPLALRLTLLGLPEGWAAFAPDGRYKLDGSTTGQFWHAIGMCRFEPGDLNQYLPEIRQLPHDAPF